MLRVFALSALLFAFGAEGAAALDISDTPAPADTPLPQMARPKPLAHCKAALHQRGECTPAYRPARTHCHGSAGERRCM